MLETLVVSEWDLNDGALVHLSQLPALSEFKLGSCYVVDEAIAHLSSLVSLTKLSVAEHDLRLRPRGLTHQLSNTALAHIACISRLRHLCLRDMPGITNYRVNHLSLLSELQLLEVLNCAGETRGPCERCFNHMPGLELRLESCDAFYG